MGGSLWRLDGRSRPPDKDMSGQSQRNTNFSLASAVAKRGRRRAPLLERILRRVLIRGESCETIPRKSVSRPDGADLLVGRLHPCLSVRGSGLVRADVLQRRHSGQTRWDHRGCRMGAFPGSILFRIVSSAFLNTVFRVQCIIYNHIRALHHTSLMATRPRR